MSTEERRVERYIWGLKTAIREFVEIQKPGTFQFVVDVVVPSNELVDVIDDVMRGSRENETKLDEGT